MIYLDTSVLFAALLNEERKPPASFWSTAFISSHLLEYEIRTRLNARGVDASVLEAATEHLSRVQLIALDGPALERALRPFSVPLRTLDVIHLSTLFFLVGRGFTLELATYDKRLARAAEALGVTLATV